MRQECHRLIEYAAEQFAGTYDHLGLVHSSCDVVLIAAPFPPCARRCFGGSLPRTRKHMLVPSLLIRDRSDSRFQAFF